MVENWVTAFEFEGYMVSDKGRVMSLPHSTDVYQSKREYTAEFSSNIIAPSIKKQRYLSVQVLLCKDGAKFGRSLPRLVYQSFKGEIGKRQRVKHRDHDALNNNLSNLYILT